jgi:hypothetical protein
MRQVPFDPVERLLDLGGGFALGVALAGCEAFGGGVDVRHALRDGHRHDWHAEGC